MTMMVKWKNRKNQGEEEGSGGKNRVKGQGERVKGRKFA
jgi:hypothetical protein